MKKRIGRLTSWLLLSTLSLTLSACLAFPQNEKNTEGEKRGEKAPAWESAQSAAEAFLTAEGIVDISKREYSYDEMVGDLGELAERYPEAFSFREVGSTVAGRKMYVGVLGDPNAEKQVLVSAAIHGREYLTALLTMKMLEFCLTYYENGEYEGIFYRDLFEDTCFYVLPMTNPDGVMLSQKGTASIPNNKILGTVQSVFYSDFSAKITTQTDIDRYLRYWKANANGVDLNRNFDVLWEEYAKGTSNPSCAKFKGTYANSEPETKALIELTNSLDGLVAVLCIHAQGEVIYWNCGQEGEIASDTLKYAEEVARLNGYQIMQERNNDASYSDWCALKKDLISITVETGTGTCPLELNQLEKMWKDNFALFPLTAAYFF